MPNYERIPKLESPKPSAYRSFVCHSLFGFLSSFGIRHLAFSGASRRQPLDHPSSIHLFRVAKAIVQAVGPSLPEFDFHRRQDVAAPKRGQRYSVGIFLLELFEPLFEHRTIRDDLALAGYPRAELVPARAAHEVLLGF